MNKKLTLLVCLLSLFGLKMMAQGDTHYGIYIGLSGNNAKLSNSFYYDDSEAETRINNGDTTVRYLPVDGASVKPNASFVIGGFYEFEINKVVGLQFHALYNQYGYSLEGTVDQQNIGDNDFVTYDYKANMKMSNISAAILLKFNVVAEDLSVEVGVQPSYCFKMVKETERGISHKSVVYDSKNDYKALNVCGSVGLTWYYYDCFFLSARLNVGLIDVLKVREPYFDSSDPNTIKYKYSDGESKTNSLLVTVGYRFN